MNQDEDFICPQPLVWHSTHERLLKARPDGGLRGSSPPVPLILNGWVFSSDEEKRRRWQDTERWAEEHGFKALLPELKEDEEYRG